MENNNIPIENDEISLKELILKAKEWYHYLLSQWKIIVLAGIIGAVLGVTYSFFKKPVYTATLSFAVEDEKSGGGGLGSALGLASSFGLDLGVSGGGIFTGANLTELFKSRSMVEKTLLSPVNVNGKVISLAEMYIQNNDWRKKWKENPKFSSIQFLPNAKRDDFTRIQDSIMGVMYANLSKSGLVVGQKDKKIAIINIDVSSTNELFAKYFCEALAKEVSDFYVDTKSKKARMNMAILERQVDSIRGQLNGSITRVAVANDNTFSLNPALNVRRTPAARSQVDVQANTAILTELVKQSELAKVTLRKETPLIQVIDRPILPLPKERFGKAKGLVMGVVIVVFFTILFLIFRRLLKELIW
ncbi:Wzz/FepE/Etk N-terminal domain-containing protein [Flavobacterium sp. Fl-77]|uniref:Wzz/FepE/Etk N-terminal domain-containing protein n=1 Tax=Flavobacterium flavipigmentatum TaxID=2893884 RepID=A0AAJ2SGZ8_9FLAO|nr:MULTISPECIES: Wzz/FepE/Etk N-terminal domain-containing protein [unclassified Flavobacterium]MDX6182199.1 Wzz/FepE/Etk N-terminal domain-containing protein [Flavobacterium sp. Fl-33]MDX6185888.1 Wzz/FepE/Etk N-terminal domain-containing protein [Flavobacterium sp. Fl-77]UFH39066.1 Wzz/FepE/Etk N-terminal domain-containing protein [Flavobacterium sp. F-70]